MKNKAKMGRPPAAWVKQLADCDLDEDKQFDAYELSAELGITAKSLIVFLSRVDLPRKYEVVGKTARAVYLIKDLKDVAKKYLEPWS